MAWVYLDAQGELLFHGQVGVKDAENEKEYVAYLFEKIVFFTEIDDNKNLINRKRRASFRQERDQLHQILVHRLLICWNQ